MCILERESSTVFCNYKNTMIQNNVIATSYQSFTSLVTRIEDKLFADTTFLNHVVLCMWLPWTLVMGKINRACVGFGNKICILCCVGDNFQITLIYFLYFQNLT